MSSVTLEKQLRGVLSNTPIITANQNVLSWKRNLVNTTAGVVTLTLPATPNDNEIIGFLDINGSFNTNNLIINVGDALHNIQGDVNLTVDLASAYIELQFITSTNSWRLLDTPMPALPVFTNTAIQTANYVASNLERVLCNTTAAGFTVTLPLNPTNGDLVSIVDVANSFSESRILIVGRNGQNIINLAEDFELVIAKTSYTFIFVTGQGWLILDNAPNLSINVDYDPFRLSYSGLTLDDTWRTLNTTTGTGGTVTTINDSLGEFNNVTGNFVFANDGVYNVIFSGDINGITNYLSLRVQSGATEIGRGHLVSNASNNAIGTINIIIQVLANTTVTFDLITPNAGSNTPVSNSNRLTIIKIG